MGVEEGQLGVDVAAVGPVLRQQVPLALLLLPAVARAAHGHLGALLAAVPLQELPLAGLLARVAFEPTGAQELPGLELAARILLDLHQEGCVGVRARVVEEFLGLLLVVELLENHVVDRHPPGAVLSGVDRDPLVRVLGDLVEVGREHDHLRAVRARLAGEVHVGRAGHVQVGTHDREELGVEPVRGLVDVRLLAPGLGGCVGQIAVPVVERQVDAAHQLQHPSTRRVREHRHGRDRGEADDAVGTVLLDRVHRRGGDDLEYRVPGGAAQPALAPGALVACALGRVGHERRPSVYGILVRGTGLAPQVEQRAPDVGVLHAQRAVEIPGVGDAALAPTRLVGRNRLVDDRIVERLHLPGDDPVLGVDVPRAATRAVHAVRAAHDVVVLPAVAVELLPGAGLRVDQVLDVRVVPVTRLAVLHEVDPIVARWRPRETRGRRVAR